MEVFIIGSQGAQMGCMLAEMDGGTNFEREPNRVWHSKVN